MKNILFINVTGSMNKGDMAVGIGHIISIKQVYLSANILLLSGDFKIDST